MKLSLNWLNSLVDISDLSTEEIEERAVKAGFEIEEKIKIGSGTKTIICCHDKSQNRFICSRKRRIQVRKADFKIYKRTGGKIDIKEFNLND